MATYTLSPVALFAVFVDFCLLSICVLLIPLSRTDGFDWSDTLFVFGVVIALAHSFAISAMTDSAHRAIRPLGKFGVRFCFAALVTLVATHKISLFFLRM